MTASDWGDIYKEIDATPIINAIGSVTLVGGSTPIPEVREAMDRANSAYIPLTHLEEKAGQAIADFVGVPAAYITSGGGSALTLATAAFIAGDDDDKIQRLPDTTGMKNEILIQKRQRYWYDRCLEMAGGKLVDFGTDEETTQDDLANAIGPNTAVVHYVSYEQHPVDPHALTLDQTIEVAKDNGVPVMVDAAGQIYPLENLGKYVKAGADISCVAAKYMGAPHSTGFALGTEDAIRKLGLHSIVSYEGRRIRGIGRPHKVDRSEMMGVVAAVRRWMTMNHETRLAYAEQQSQTMIKLLQGIPGVRAELVDNVIANQPFGVKIDIDPDVAGTTVEDVVDRLKEHDPPIWTRPNPYGTGMVLHVFGLYEGEDKIVGEAMADVLKQGVPA